MTDSDSALDEFIWRTIENKADCPAEVGEAMDRFLEAELKRLDTLLDEAPKP